MSQPFNIAEQSCALFARHPGRHYDFLGTAFFFRRAGRVLGATAAHCIAEPQPPELIMASAKGNECRVSVIAIDPSVDLCLLRPEQDLPSMTMTLSKDPLVPGNISLQTYEYSATARSGKTWHVHPATRVGNCVRQLPSPFGPGGEHMLELSFPALRGASGAPVIQNRTLGTNVRMVVRGVIVANMERHLLPAQIETVLTEDNALLEERKYFLPQAAAVNAVHLARIADKWLTSWNGT